VATRQTYHIERRNPFHHAVAVQVAADLCGPIRRGPIRRVKPCKAAGAKPVPSPCVRPDASKRGLREAARLGAAADRTREGSIVGWVLRVSKTSTIAMPTHNNDLQPPGGVGGSRGRTLSINEAWPRDPWSSCTMDSEAHLCMSSGRSLHSLHLHAVFGPDM
jgi:hypothetical protein